MKYKGMEMFKNDQLGQVGILYPYLAYVVKYLEKIMKHC